MTAIWEPENKFRIWFEIEAHACDAQAKLGVIPEAAAREVWEKGAFEVARIDQIERETHHDVIAFLTNLAEHVGPAARFVHQGMTSSDVLDTCFSVQLVRATDLLLDDMDQLLAVLRRRAFEHKDDICIGRSHGIHAEPTTFGLKLAQAYAEFDRCRDRLRRARQEIATCAISGAVGTFANIDPAVEQHVANALGLTVEPVSTQVIPRDRHAMYFSTLAVIASSIERLATEIRHLQRSEVLEVEEFFAEGQKGSSAMPHKRNPVLTENLTGLARLVRMTAMPALENVARARHLPLQRRTGHRTRCDRNPGFCPKPPDRGDRQVNGISGKHAGKPGSPGRLDLLATGAAGFDPGQRQPRRRLYLCAAERHAGLARRRKFSGSAEGRR